MQKFTDLQVWQRSHQWVLAVYRLSAKLPVEERYGLCSQLRRAAMSVPTNIAEGAKRQSQLEFARFLNISESSLSESDYLLLLAHDLSYFDKPSVDPLRAEADEIARMLHALRSKVEEAAR